MVSRRIFQPNRSKNSLVLNIPTRQRRFTLVFLAYIQNSSLVPSAGLSGRSCDNASSSVITAYYGEFAPLQLYAC